MMVQSDFQRGSILVVDDDKDIRDFLKVYIESSDYTYHAATNYKEALETVEKQKVDLIILDVLMPYKDGFDTCKDLRSKTNVPIIFLSCKNQEMDIIMGLSVGADDYITKPFLPGELMARINSHIRRTNDYTDNEKETNLLQFCKINVDLISREIKIDDEAINLLPKEYDILVLFLKYPGRIFSKNEIFQYIWNDHVLESDINTVTVHISNLRKKIASPENDSQIVTVKGIGYKLVQK